VLALQVFELRLVGCQRILSLGSEFALLITGGRQVGLFFGQVIALGGYLGVGFGFGIKSGLGASQLFFELFCLFGKWCKCLVFEEVDLQLFLHLMELQQQKFVFLFELGSLCAGFSAGLTGLGNLSL